MSARRTLHRPARSARAQTPEPEITARPRAWSQDVTQDPDETYASMEPEDLGQYALREATQSGPGAIGADAQLSASAPSASDEPLSRPNGARDDDLWEETIDQALEAGGSAATRRAARVENDPDAADEATWSRDIDLRQSSVVEASLFDPGSEETTYETREPEVSADNDSPEHVSVGDEGAEARAGEPELERSQSAGGRVGATGPLKPATRHEGGRAATKRAHAASTGNKRKR